MTESKALSLRAARLSALTLINPDLYADDAPPADAKHAFACTVGIVLELPTIRPSNVEIASVLGYPVTRVREAVAAWYDLTWRERHGWCMLAEAWHGRTTTQRR